MDPPPPMYPDWPESQSDLVPLPSCDGPKLRPFDFKGPQNIEFLEKAGDGTHSIVYKVRISGNIYALKVFRYLWTEEWADLVHEGDKPDASAMAVFSQYSEPFNAECRAFGRLEESGHTELAIKCYGYVLLDKKHENALKSQFPDLEAQMYDGGREHGDKLRTIHVGARSGRPPPFRAIIKEFGQEMPQDEIPKFDPTNRILRSVKQLHQLGIIGLDLGDRQIINGKLGDFSTALTAPHYLMTPGLNPKITPEWKSVMEGETFKLCISDYIEFDGMVEYELRPRVPPSHKHIKFPLALPNGPGLGSEYNLRAKSERGRLFTYANPTSLVDRQESFNAAVAGSKGRSPNATSKPPWPLKAKPDRWWCECYQGAAEYIRARRCDRVLIDFCYRDGHIFPANQQRSVYPKVLDWRDVDPKPPRAVPDTQPDLARLRFPPPQSVLRLQKQ